MNWNSINMTLQRINKFYYQQSNWSLKIAQNNSNNQSHVERDFVKREMKSKNSNHRFTIGAQKMESRNSGVKARSTAEKFDFYFVYIVFVIICDRKQHNLSFDTVKWLFFEFYSAFSLLAWRMEPLLNQTASSQWLTQTSNELTSKHENKAKCR